MTVDLSSAASPAGRYKLGDLIATGGHGEVFMAVDQETGAEVVVKRLKSQLTLNDPNLVQRFLREGEMLRQLNHPNIVAVLDSFQRDGQHHLVIEYIAGGSLRQLMDRRGQLPLTRALEITLEIADALSRAHHLRVIHRDIKPENILIAADGTPRLTDFGIAHLDQGDVRLTQTGTLIGSPAYMSPEALQAQRLDSRSDIWSLGVMLFEMLTGKRPFTGNRVTAILLSIISDPPPELSQFRQDVPSGLQALLNRMLAKEREDRPTTMRQVAAALEAIRGELTGKASALAGSFGLIMPPVEQTVQFATAPDGKKIAYASSGEASGRYPLVKVGNWLTHLEYDWNSPIWRHWLVEFSSRFQLWRYDERGNGLSDWDVPEVGFRSWQQDLDAVVAAAGLNQFALMGIAQGGPIALAYAAEYPERVSHLILYASYASGAVHRPVPDQSDIGALIPAGWGQENADFRAAFSELYLPEGTAEQYSWFQELQRVSTSPENAQRFWRAFQDVDVQQIARHVRVPTLILHNLGDHLVPIGEGQYLSELIPNATFVALESSNHLILENESAWLDLLHEVDAFLNLPEADPPETVDSSELVKSARATPSFITTPRVKSDILLADIPFIGRDEEITELAEKLSNAGDQQLITILGPGGVGKSRLALAVGQAIQNNFADGAFFVPLAPLSDSTNIVGALAEAMNLRFASPATRKNELLAHLSDKQTLLIFDNFDHVLAGAPLVAEILQASPKSRAIATSRERLNISREQTYPIVGLTYPGGWTPAAKPTETSEQRFAAVELFIQQAGRIAPQTDLSGHNMAAIQRICRLVEGAPLAIIMAAGWLEMLTIDEIAAEIADSVDFLATELRDVPARQQSMRAVFEGSWQRLSESEQQAYLKLSVFRGSFSRQSADQVAGASLRQLRSLINKSLVTVDEDQRFSIQELLRQFAAEKLDQSGQYEAIVAAHGRYYLKRITELEMDLQGGDQKGALDILDRNWENIRIAWQWAVNHGEKDLLFGAMEATHLYADMRIYHEMAADMLDAAAPLFLPVQKEYEVAASRLLSRRSFLNSTIPRDSDRIVPDLNEAIILAAAHDGLLDQSVAQLALASYSFIQGQASNDTLSLLQEARANARNADSILYETRALIWMGIYYMSIKQPFALKVVNEEALEIARRHNNQADTAVALVNLGEAEIVLGEYRAAREHLVEAMRLGELNSSFIIRDAARQMIDLLDLLEGKIATVSNHAPHADTPDHSNLASVTQMDYALKGLQHCAEGQYHEALRAVELGLAIQTGDPLIDAIVLWANAFALCGLRRMDAAREATRAFVSAARMVKSNHMAIWSMPHVAWLMAQDGEWAYACQLWSWADDTVGSPVPWLRHTRLFADFEAILSLKLGPQAFAENRSLGRRLKPAEQTWLAAYWT